MHRTKSGEWFLKTVDWLFEDLAHDIGQVRESGVSSQFHSQFL